MPPTYGREERHIAAKVTTSLAREQELHEQLCRLDPSSPEWKATLELLGKQTQFTSGAWDQHFTIRRAQRAGIIQYHDRTEHMVRLISDLAGKTSPDALRALVIVENKLRLDPPLADETLEALLP